MSKKTIITLVLVFLAVFIVFGTVTNMIIFNSGAKGLNLRSGLKGEYFEVDDKKTIDLDGVEVVNISVVSSDVNLYEVSGDMDVSLKMKGVSTGEKVKLIVDEMGSTVNIKVEYPRFNVRLNVQSSILDISLPSDYEGQININSVSGDVSSNGAFSSSLVGLDIGTTSGDVDFANNSVAEFDAKSVSGDVSLESSITKSSRVSTTSGDIDISNIADGCEDVYAKSVSGGVMIDYDKACRTEIRTVSGDIELSVSGNQAIDLDYSSTSGDMSGNVNMNDAGAVFKVSSTSGDLRFR